MNSFAPSFGAVKLSKTSGFSPTPAAFPFSTSHPDGMSTETIGSPDAVSSGRAASSAAPVRAAAAPATPRVTEN